MTSAMADAQGATVNADATGAGAAGVDQTAEGSGEAQSADGPSRDALVQLLRKKESEVHLYEAKLDKIEER